MEEWETAVMEHGCGLQHGGLRSSWKAQMDWEKRRDAISYRQTLKWDMDN